MTTELKPDRYLELLQADAARLASVAARGLDAVVPTCPGWTVRDALVHTGHVYLHKVVHMRTQARAEFPPEPAPERDEVQWFSAALETLVGELVARGPDAPSYTWWPADQTVGFWYRRMSQETAVHRYDVESAFDATTPVAEDLAVDGVDEMLERFLSGDWAKNVDAEEWGDVSPEAGAGKSILVRTGTTAWRVALYPDRIDFERGASDGDASVTGEPSNVLLWLWGRVPDSAVTLAGDTGALAALRGRLHIAGQ
jgi:uncharacterized protein (TIGR03083 family)